VLISQNVKFKRPLRLSSFRKVAMGTWRTVGDPSVYATLEFEVDKALEYIKVLSEKSSAKLTLTHFVGKACGETIRRHPELNCILRLGQLYPRSAIDIFFQVATDSKGDDLSGTTIRNIDQKSLPEIANEMQARVGRIRQTGDVDYKQMKKTMRMLPGFMSGFVLRLSSFLMYTLNLWTALLGVPKDPFGSIMITNIGSIGLDNAFVPLVPYSRIPCLVALGSVKDCPVVKDGNIEIAKIVKLCITFDHRIIDGMHASHMAKTLTKIFADPWGELGK
jgi:pyruvate dehydrogenase E2 component (dihydrolipoamide acetyltransferase)